MSDTRHSIAKDSMDYLHGQYVYQRRVTVLTEHLARAVPADATVLDVGCGDGLIARCLGDRRGDLQISGIDVKIRPTTFVPVAEFDGSHIPAPDAGFDVVMFVDVLHHTDDPLVLLREAARVARRAIVIKDHTQDGLLAHSRLRFMDWVGNARHGVRLPYNYWTSKQWSDAFGRLHLAVDAWNGKLNLYPPPLGWVFDRSLHFVARLRRDGAADNGLPNPRRM